MTPTEVIALTAVSLSLLTFIATQLGNRNKDTKSYVEDLEHRIKQLELDKEHLVERNKVLFEENLHLMKKLTANGRGG